jgi:hypothetical protein
MPRFESLLWRLDDSTCLELAESVVVNCFCKRLIFEVSRPYTRNSANSSLTLIGLGEEVGRIGLHYLVEGE